MTILFERIIEHYKVDNIHDIWPNLSIYAHGGVSFEPYKSSFEKLLGKPITYIETYLASEGFIALQLHPDKSVVSRTTDGIRFLGYRVFPNLILLPRENMIRWRRKLRQMQAGFADGSIGAEEIGPRIASWHGHACQADSLQLRTDILSTTVFTRTTEAADW